MRHPIAGFLLAAAIPAMMPAEGVAQRQHQLIPSGTAVGVTGGAWVIAGDGGYSIPMVSLHVSDLLPGRVTPEFALGMAPTVAVAGGALLVTDLDVAYSAASPEVTLLVGAGASAAALLGAGGAGGLIGGNAEVAALIRVAPAFGLRIGGAYRPILDDGGLRSTFSLGLGFTSLPNGGR